MTPLVSDLPQDTIEAYKEISFKEKANIPTLRMPYCNVIPVLGFNENNYRLKEPIQFFIEAEESYYVGIFKPLGIYCYGESPLEVETELRADILYIYEDLKNTPNKQLSNELKLSKKYLMGLIEDVSGE